MIKKRFLKKLFSTFILLFILLNIKTVSSDINFEGYSRQVLTKSQKELHETPSIAKNNDNIHIVWATWPDEYNCEINYIRSLDNGKNWSEISNLTDNISKALNPAITVQNNYVHVVWKDFRNQYPEIYYIYSKDNGDTWSEHKRLTFNSTRLSTIFDINLYSYKQNLYLLWKDYRSGSAEVFYKTSKDNGQNWEEDKRLTFDYKPSYSPSLEIDENNLYIAFEEWGTNRGSICFLKSNNNGYTWLNKIYLTDNYSDGDSKYPDISVYENNIYVVWQDDRTDNYEIFLKKSNDLGQTWFESKQITSNDYASVSPKIYSYKNQVFLFWSEIRNKMFNILYKTSNDYGNSWSETKILVDDHDCYELKLIGEKENILFVWQQYHEPTWGDILYMSDISYNTSQNNKPNNVDEKVNETPGFEFYMILTILVILIIFKIKKRSVSR